MALGAAAYGWTLARSHTFHAGNKRIAFMIMAVFTELNGERVESTEDAVVTLVVGVASNRITEDELANWVRGHLVRRKQADR